MGTASRTYTAKHEHAARPSRSRTSGQAQSGTAPGRPSRSPRVRRPCHEQRLGISNFAVGKFVVIHERVREEKRWLGRKLEQAPCYTF